MMLMTFRGPEALVTFGRLRVIEEGFGAMERSTCYFGGRVQGVGFRYTVLNIVQEYDVTGYVQNLSDGRVQLVAEGTKAELNSLIEKIKQRMEGFVEDVDVTISPATGEFRRFTIQH